MVGAVDAGGGGGEAGGEVVEVVDEAAEDSLEVDELAPDFGQRNALGRNDNGECRAGL
jgi:hypothetical protein